MDDSVITRRAWFAASASAILVVASRRALGQPAPVLPAMHSYLMPNCDCCGKWIEHVRKAGFAVTTEEVPDFAALTAKYHVPESISICHISVVGGYAVVGHVPADLIVKMVTEKSDVAGIAVNGMPSSSPGMEGMGSGRAVAYDVLAFDANGGTRVYARR